MKVSELIAKLEELPADAEVYVTDGHDEFTLYMGLWLAPITRVQHQREDHEERAILS